MMLIAEAMGLGAWIHASLSPPILLGDPKFTTQYGNMLGFDFVTPRFRLLDISRFGVHPRRQRPRFKIDPQRHRAVGAGADAGIVAAIVVGMHVVAVRIVERNAAFRVGERGRRSGKRDPSAHFPRARAR